MFLIRTHRERTIPHGFAKVYRRFIALKRPRVKVVSFKLISGVPKTTQFWVQKAIRPQDGTRFLWGLLHGYSNGMRKYDSDFLLWVHISFKVSRSMRLVLILLLGVLPSDQKHSSRNSLKFVDTIFLVLKGDCRGE